MPCRNGNLDWLFFFPFITLWSYAMSFIGITVLLVNRCSLCFTERGISAFRWLVSCCIYLFVYFLHCIICKLTYHGHPCHGKNQRVHSFRKASLPNCMLRTVQPPYATTFHKQPAPIGDHPFLVKAQWLDPLVSDSAATTFCADSFIICYYF